MRFEDVVDQVERRGGFGAPSEALRAIAATLPALGQRLFRDESQAIARALPEPMAQLLFASTHERDFGVDALYRRVSEAEGLPLGVAVEHAQIVCQVVGEALDDETVLRLRRHLPAELIALLWPRPELAPAEPPVPDHKEAELAPGAGTTLATGRPGSRRPLSEARCEAAHEHSVVREPNPHGDTKLSSSNGMTQERLGETLAEGDPGSPRPLSRAKA